MVECYRLGVRSIPTAATKFEISDKASSKINFTQYWNRHAYL